VPAHPNEILDARARLCLHAELLETVRHRLANPQPGVKVSLDELWVRVRPACSSRMAEIRFRVCAHTPSPSPFSLEGNCRWCGRSLTGVRYI